LEPHILRALSNIKAISVHTSAHACHQIVLDVDGIAWLFGRNGKSCALGVPNTIEAISESAPRKLTALELGGTPTTKFVHAACGRNHTLLVGSEGQLWSAGINNLGQVRVCVNLHIVDQKNIPLLVWPPGIA
jgi:alpha-tubulin suppressor-like RCC1 family protein